MFKKYFFICFAFYSFSLQAQVAKKVLFIGNSLTYFNDMPKIFESIANEKGKNVVVDSYSPGGTGFLNHVSDNNVYNLFKNSVWDYVVLQPGTSESGGASFPISTTSLRGKQLQDSIKKYSPCAKVLLYEISNGVASETSFNNYFLTQTRIKDSITKLSNSMQVPLVAAGECFRNHYSSQQNFLLHNSYGDIHPNLNGSYLVACAMFCSVFQETVSGVVFNGGVSPANATYFQGISDDVILNNKALWLLNTYNLHAEFASVQTDNIINFTNLSVNFTSLLWDFGDGTTSTEINPTHFYNRLGSKIVTLTATKNGCSEIYTKVININVLHADVFEAKGVSVFPSITNSEFFISSEDVFFGDLYNSFGQKIRSFEKKDKEISIDLTGFATGMYLIKIKNATYKVVKK